MHGNYLGCNCTPCSYSTGSETFLTVITHVGCAMSERIAEIMQQTPQEWTGRCL